MTDRHLTDAAGSLDQLLWHSTTRDLWLFRAALLLDGQEASTPEAQAFWQGRVARIDAILQARGEPQPQAEGHAHACPCPDCLQRQLEAVEAARAAHRRVFQDD